jgi:hypothetical protein
MSPNGGEILADTHTVTWTASDGDGDPLVYAVHYSPDGGATWRPLAMDLSEPSWDWDTGQSPGAHASGLVRVIASDGFNTSEDRSDGPFSVAPKAPSVSVLRPVPGAVFTHGAPMIFEAIALDLEQDWLPNAAFAWASDQDGLLGSGSPFSATLSLGQHRITLTATDGDGLSASEQITVTVSGETRPDLSISADAIIPSWDPAVCSQGWISALPQNVVTDTVATVSFHDGDPENGGALIGQFTRFFKGNAISEANVVWRPTRPGEHQIFVTFSDADPDESDASNNQAMTTITVAEGNCDLYLPTLLNGIGHGR